MSVSEILDHPVNRDILSATEAEMARRNADNASEAQRKRGIALRFLLRSIERWHRAAGHSLTWDQCGEPICAAAHPSVLR